MPTQDFGKYNYAVRDNGLRLSTNEPLVALGTVTLPSGTTIGGSSVSALGAITSATATAFTVASTSTNYGLQVDESTSSAITGLKIKAAASGAGVALSALGSTNEALTLDGKGSGAVVIGGTSTGQVSVGRGSLTPVIQSNTVTSLGTHQSVTPTAAQLVGGVITMTGATGAGTCTLDTGTNLSSAVTGVAVGDSFTCVFAVLGGGQTVTITGATGSTVIGTAAVASGKNALMTFVNTGSNTWNVYCNVSA